MLVQTRDDDGELKYFSSFAEAYSYALGRPAIWKISFNDPGNNVKRIRLVRDKNDKFVLDQLSLDDISDAT